MRDCWRKSGIGSKQQEGFTVSTLKMREQKGSIILTRICLVILYLQGLKVVLK